MPEFLPFEVRPPLPSHPAIAEWGPLRISPVVAALSATASENHPPREGRHVTALLDTLLDLWDAVTAFGLNLPLVLVVAVDGEPASDTFRAWRNLAGDQDRLRGGLSILPVSPAAEGQTLLDKAQRQANKLSDPNYLATRQYRLKTLSSSQYLELIQERLPNQSGPSQWLSQRVIRVFEGLDLQAPSQGNPAEQAVRQWIDEDVASQARLALSQSLEGKA